MFYDGEWFMGGMHFLWWIFWVGIVAAFVWALWGRPGGRTSDADRTVERRETGETYELTVGFELRPLSDGEERNVVAESA